MVAGGGGGDPGSPADVVGRGARVQAGVVKLLLLRRRQVVVVLVPGPRLQLGQAGAELTLDPGQVVLALVDLLLRRQQRLMLWRDYWQSAKA